VNYYFPALFDFGGGVFNNARNESSKLTLLRLGSLISRRFFFFRGFLFTLSFSAPRFMRWMWFNQTIPLLVKPIPSTNRCLVCKSLSLSQTNGFNHALSIAQTPRIPAESEFIGILRKMLFGDVVPRADHAALEEGKKRLAIVHSRKAAVRIALRVLLALVHNGVVRRPVQPPTLGCVKVIIPVEPKGEWK
jgi:hypothetical protein